MIRLTLPHHLRNLAGTGEEVRLEIPPPVTLAALLEALESRYPALRGTIREHVTLRRRPMVRFYAGTRDISHDPPDQPLPDAIATGAAPLRIIGAVAGG